MGEVREFWANVYRKSGGGVFVTETQHATRDQARRFSTSQRIGCVHVRLKPEGAPKRYISADNRAAWERDPGTCMSLAAAGYVGLFRQGVGFFAGRSPRTPKIEERT